MILRRGIVELVCVFTACVVLSMAFTAPWYPNTTSIPAAYPGKAEFFARVDASMWTYMLAWGAKHPEKFYSAPILLPVQDPLVANDPRLTEGVWSIPLFRLFPPVLAWGITLWLALTLTATGCYYAGKILTASRWGGVAMVVLFSFGMFRANHVCHIEGIFVPFLALAFALMVRFLESVSNKGRALPDFRGEIFRPDASAVEAPDDNIRAVSDDNKPVMIGFALALAASVVEYSYIAVPLGIILPVSFIVGGWLRKIRWKQGLVPLILAGILVLIVMAPVAFKYASFYQMSGVKRHIMQVDSCSADLFSWITGATGQILPPFGGQGHDSFDSHLFPGFIVAILGFFGLVLLWRKSPEILVAGALALLLSFGTMRFLVWQLELTNPGGRTPYEVLYDLLLPFQAIRAPARFGVLTHLALAFAGALVIAQMAVSRKWRCFAVILLAVSFIEARAGIHAVKILPDRYNDPAYRWLAEQEGDFAVLEAPMGLAMVREQHATEAGTMLVSLIHGRPMPNGTLAADMPWHESIAVNLANPAHAEAKKLMQALGIRYVVTGDAVTAAKYASAGYKLSVGSSRAVSIFEIDSPMTVPSGLSEVAARLSGNGFYEVTHSERKPDSADLRAPAEIVLQRGRRFVMPVVVKNSGHNTWAGASRIYGKGDGGDVFVGVRRWKRVTAGDAEFAVGPRGNILTAAGYLPSNLNPGESGEVFVTGIAPIRPGRYFAEVDLCVKGVGWVSPPDKPPVVVATEVK